VIKPSASNTVQCRRKNRIWKTEDKARESEDQILCQSSATRVEVYRRQDATGKRLQRERPIEIRHRDFVIGLSGDTLIQDLKMVIHGVGVINHLCTETMLDEF